MLILILTLYKYYDLIGYIYWILMSCLYFYSSAPMPYVIGVHTSLLCVS